MGCEICGRNSCTRSFHQIDEQLEFDKVADEIKERMRESLKRQINRLPDTSSDQSYSSVNLDDVLSIIDNY